MITLYYQNSHSSAIILGTTDEIIYYLLSLDITVSLGCLQAS